MNYEIEIFAHTIGAGPMNQKYDDIKKLVWGGTGGALDISIPQYVTRVVLADSTFFYALGTQTGLMFKTELVSYDEEKRGKGDKIDGAYKLYQDRLDVICLCQIRFRQEIRVAGAGDGSYVGNEMSSILPATFCPAAPIPETYAEPISAYNECINVKGLADYSCPKTGLAEDTQNCKMKDPLLNPNIIPLSVEYKCPEPVLSPSSALAAAPPGAPRDN